MSTLEMSLAQRIALLPEAERTAALADLDPVGHRMGIISRVATETHGTIYLLSDPRDNRPCYIGKTIYTPEYRLAEHLRDARKPRNQHRRVIRWIKLLIAKDLRPVLTVIATAPMDQLGSVEQATIIAYRAGGHDLMNHTGGGDGGRTTGMLGHPRSAATRAAIGAANTKSANPERARKISEFKILQWQDPEYRKKMTEAGRRGGQANRNKPERPRDV